MTDYPSSYPDYEDYYECSALDCGDIYKEIYRFSHLVDTGLSFITILVNVFHLSVLVQKELRSISIFVLMMGICIADILGFLFVFYEYGIERFWIQEIMMYFNFQYPYVDSFCLSFDYQHIDVLHEINTLIQFSSRPISIWLAMFMALIRTLSVIFPMSNWIQKLTKVSVAVVIVITVGVVWLIYYSWHYLLAEFIWYSDHLNYYCFEPQLVPNATILVMSEKYAHIYSDREQLTYLVRGVPAILYPFLTVFLIIELAKIKKRREKMRSTENEKTDNTTKLILVMTISFMMSEGLVAVTQYLMIMPELMFLKLQIYTVETFLQTFRSLNALSHCFVCYWMSTQYRDTVKRMFSCCCERKIKVKMAKGSGADESRIFKIVDSKLKTKSI